MISCNAGKGKMKGVSSVPIEKEKGTGYFSGG